MGEGGRRGGDENDAQPIALRSFSAARPHPRTQQHGLRRRVRRGRRGRSGAEGGNEEGEGEGEEEREKGAAMATRGRQKHQAHPGALALDGADDGPLSVETITPTPRASKFAPFKKRPADASTPQLRRASLDADALSDAASTPATSAAAHAPMEEGEKRGGEEEKDDDALVEIKVRRRRPEEAAQRSAGSNALDASAFDDLPAAETYDPAWNTAPLRCEAGQLRHGRHTAAKAPVLPGAFRLDSADLNDEDEEDEEDAKAKREKEAAVLSKLKRGKTVGVSGAPAASAAASKKGGGGGGEGITERQRAALGRLFIKRRLGGGGGKENSGGGGAVGSPGRVELKLKKANRNAIESVRESRAAMHHLSVILQCDYQAEIVAHKGAELRIRVPIAVGGEMSPHLVVVSAADGAERGSRMTLRRSLTDISRISHDEFFTFCEDVARRFRRLEQSSGRE